MGASSSAEQALYTETINQYVSRTLDRAQVIERLARIGFDDVASADLLLEVDTNTAIRGLQIQNDTLVKLGQGREGNLKRAGAARDKLLAALRSLERAAAAHLETTDGSEREYLREECSAARAVIAEVEKVNA